MKIIDVFGEMPILETNNLILRKIRKDDVDDFYEYSSNPEVTKYLSYIHTKKEDAEEYISKKIEQYSHGTCMIWGIENKKDKKYIGACGFTHWDIENNFAEIAYTLSQKYWGQGFASEIMEKIIEFGFNKMMLNRIEALCFKDNEKSYKLMEKFNMKLEGVFFEKYLLKGMYQDMKMYSLLRKNYNK
ncbi:MAG: GNAT family N-acetyltransferase [Fusobacteriaceae bacterium]|nr:GNAT family N-acetyltransferase [Fusobacteriaceae bacterium]